MSILRNKTTLFSRWVIFNTLLMALFIVGYANGVLDQFITDDTFITHGIAVVFGFVLVASGYTSLVIGRQWNNLTHIQNTYRSRKAAGSGSDYLEVLTEAGVRRMSWFRIAGPFLVSLGLLGTVIGIRLGFSDVSADAVGNVDMATTIITSLLGGLATALNTTAVGMVGMVWNMINLHMMQQETSRFFSAVLEE